jgi:hypothetical protein
VSDVGLGAGSKRDGWAERKHTAQDKHTRQQSGVEAVRHSFAHSEKRQRDAQGAKHGTELERYWRVQGM